MQCLALLAVECKCLLPNLGPEAKALLEICQIIQNSSFREEDISRLAKNRVLDDYTEDFLEKLTYDGLLVLSLLTTHFDQSLHGFPKSPLPPRRLLEFFCQEDDLEQLCEILWDRYNDLSTRKKSRRQLVEMLTRLLRFFEFGFVLFLLDPH